MRLTDELCFVDAAVAQKNLLSQIVDVTRSRQPLR